MLLQRILVTVDFSNYDKPALEMAVSLVHDSGAKLLIVHVLEAPVAYGGTMYQGELNPSEERIRQMLTAIVPNDETISYEHALIQGESAAALKDTDIAHAIVQFGDHHNVDLIVTSTYGRSGVQRILLGSVAEKLVSRSQRPVLTLKPPN